MVKPILMLGGCSSQHVVIFATAAGLRPARPPAALAVAIDFGTYASGFAYAPIPQHQHQHQPRAAPAGLPPRVQLHTAWPGQPAPDPKTRTAVLYRGRSLVGAAGWAFVIPFGLRVGGIENTMFRVDVGLALRLPFFAYRRGPLLEW